VGAVPIALTGAAGGGARALATVAGAQSLGQPENLAQNVALGSAPVPIGRAVSPLVRRLRGKATPGAPITNNQINLTGAVEDEAALRAAAQQAEMRAVAPESALSATSPTALTVSPRTAGSVAGDVISLPRAIMSSGDISAPLRQGAVLSLSPRNAPQAVRAGIRMFQSLRPRQYERITAEITDKAETLGANQAGLYLASNRALNQAEEAFVSSLAERLPVVGKGLVQPSNRAYTSYLDSLRVDVFAKYKRAIDRAIDDEALRNEAYKSAAKFINYASGRGTLGETLDRAMVPLGSVLFAPRYAASRFNLLNPVTYIKMNPIARREAMKDLVGFASVVGSTLALAKAAGAEVTLNPLDSDFGKIKVGNWRYDIGAGLIQHVRTIARISEALYKRSQGEKPKLGQSAGDIAGRFVRSKLAPLPGYIWDAQEGKDYTGKKFDPVKGGIERITPLFEQELVEAIIEEGGMGALKASPGALGIGVQNFERTKK